MSNQRVPSSDENTAAHCLHFSTTVTATLRGILGLGSQ
jgi:hypothetical protein